MAQGKLLYMRVDGLEIVCQTDLTLNMTANTTDAEPCKPLSTDTENASLWLDRDVTSKEWDASVTARNLVNDITANNTNISQLAKVFVDGSNVVEVVVQTNSSNEAYGDEQTFIFTGTAIMTGLTLNGAEEGNATGDVTFNSKGKPTWVQVDVTPTP